MGFGTIGYECNADSHINSANDTSHSSDVVSKANNAGKAAPDHIDDLSISAAVGKAVPAVAPGNSSAYHRFSQSDDTELVIKAVVNTTTGNGASKEH